MADRNLALQLLITARDQASEILGRTGAAVRGIGQAVNEALTPLRSFQGLIATAIGVGSLNELKERADAYTRLTNSLKVATTSEEDYRTALETVTTIAQRTFSDLETTASLYARVAQNATAMGLSQKQVADLTELISKGMQLGGASAAEYASATLQLTQAFGSGVLRGEEFNSVMEASPELMRRLAAGLGVAIGELRGLAEQGRLTASTVAQALLSQKEAIDTAYAETTQTVEQALTNLSSKVTLFIGQMSESSNASSAAANTLNFLSENINVVAAALGGGLVYAAGKAAVSMGSYVQASLAARAAAQEQAVAAAAQERAALASAQANVAAAQAAVNRAVQEQRLANEITRLLTAELGVSATEAEVTAARARSASAATAATAATQRYAQAQAQLQALQASAAASTGLFAKAMGFLTGPAGLILLAVSAFAALIPALSSNKKGMDDLVGSTEDYAKTLKDATAAQIEAARLDLEQQLRQQQSVVDDLTASVRQQTEWYERVAAAGGNVSSATDELNRRQAELDTATQKTNALQERLNTLLKEREQRQSVLSAGAEQQTVQYAQQALKMDEVANTLERLAKQQKAVSSADEQRLQSLIEIAEAAGDYQRVEELSIQLAQRRAQTAQEQANLDQVAAVAAQAKVTALENEYKNYQTLAPAQTAALQSARDDAQARQAQAGASQAAADAARRQAGSAQLLTTAEEKNVQIARNYTHAVESVVNAQLDGLRAEIDLARAKGHTYEAQRLTSELAIKEAQAALRVAQAKQREQEMEYALAVAKRDRVKAQVEKNQATQEDLQLAELTVQKELAEAQAAGVNAQAQEVLAQKLREVNAARAGTSAPTGSDTAATQENTAATQENNEAKEEAKQQSESVGQTIAGERAYWRELTKGMSEATDALRNRLTDAYVYWLGLNRGAVETTRSWNKELVENAESVGELRQALVELTIKQQEIDYWWRQQVNATAGLSKVISAVTRGGIEAAKAYTEQRLALELYVEQMTRVGEVGQGSMATVQRATQAVRSELGLLNQQDLDRLQSEIDAATQRLQAMQEATRSTRGELTELQAELLEAQGFDKKAELLRQQLDYTQKLADIERQRQEAEATGNREQISLLDQKKRVLEEINQVKVANIQAETAAAEATERTAKATATLADKADAIERIGKAMGGMVSHDYDKVTRQMKSLADHLTAINEVL